jgi:hypothetical protein
MTNASLNTATARFLFDLTRSRTADILHEWRANDPRNPILGHDATELVGRDAEQDEIKQAEFSRQVIMQHRGAGQECYAGEVKRQQRRIFREQLLIAFLLFPGFVAVFVDRKLGSVSAITRPWRTHTLKSHSFAPLRVFGWKACVPIFYSEIDDRV